MMSEIDTSGSESAARGETVSPLAVFRVREGRRFGASNEYGPGDVVRLPPSVLTAFGDKLELVDGGDPEIGPEGEPPSKPKTARGK